MTEQEEFEFRHRLESEASKTDAFANGPIKIGADAWPDALRAELKNASWFDRNWAGAGTALDNTVEGIKQFYGQGNAQNVANNKIVESEAPVGALAGNVALTAVPFAKVGSTIPAAAKVGSAFGLTRPVENTQTALDVVKGKGANAVIGGVTSAGGQWGANKILSGVSNKLASIEQKVSDKAAQVAASDTASARSAAGSAAQAAYKQLEHLRELGVNRPLTEAEQLTFNSLERELAEKALEKLMPAAAMKESTSAAYKEAMQTEAERAAQYATDKLSGNEVKQQIMARLLRYGPAVAGGLVGNMIFPGLGGAVGGAATGLTLRPAIRSMANLLKNPAVQHNLLSPVKDSGSLSSPMMPTASALLGMQLLGQ